MAFSYGLKVSKAGSNVLTTSEANLQFTSQYPVLKVHMQGEVSGDSSYEIAHGLGYTPTFMCWAKGVGNSNRFLLPRFYLGADPVGGINRGLAWADATNLYIGLSGTSNVYYYIFVERVV